MKELIYQFSALAVKFDQLLLFLSMSVFTQTIDCGQDVIIF